MSALSISLQFAELKEMPNSFVSLVFFKIKTNKLGKIDIYKISLINQMNKEDEAFFDGIPVCSLEREETSLLVALGCHENDEKVDKIEDYLFKVSGDGTTAKKMYFVLIRCHLFAFAVLPLVTRSSINNDFIWVI